MMTLKSLTYEEGLIVNAGVTEPDDEPHDYIGQVCRRIDLS